LVQVGSSDNETLSEGSPLALIGSPATLERLRKLLWLREKIKEMRHFRKISNQMRVLNEQGLCEGYMGQQPPASTPYPADGSC
jgi:hypothetical protein